jgi:NAD(P)-dependent dehydrogenase (short-subunit alcohol dehydrogenase family)
VVLAVRDTAKGEAAAESISGNCEVRRLDLADLASERAFANAWQGDSDVLINNAGVMRTPKRRTADGFEPEIGTNHLGHFALTNLLLPHVTDRVVTSPQALTRRLNLPGRPQLAAAYLPTLGGLLAIEVGQFAVHTRAAAALDRCRLASPCSGGTSGLCGYQSSVP